MRVDGASTFLTIAEAAIRARQSTRTIRRAIAGEVRPLRHFRIGRRVVISETDLDRWVGDHAVMPCLKPKVLRDVEALFPELLGHPRVTHARPPAEKFNAHKE